MDVRVEAHEIPAKGGTGMRAPRLRLVGYGPSRSRAEHSLRLAIHAWWVGSKRAGTLAKALHDAGLSFEGTDTDPRLTIELVPLP